MRTLKSVDVVKDELEQLDAEQLGVPARRGRRPQGGFYKGAELNELKQQMPDTSAPFDFEAIEQLINEG